MVWSVLWITLVTMVPVQAAVPDEAADRVAIRQAVLDYAEGFYDHATERMTRAISPLLTKRALAVRPGVPPFLSQMNSEMLIEATRGTGGPAAAQSQLVAEVLDINGDIASARVFSVQFNDYVHLVKRDGRWQLVSVLWHNPPSPPANPTAGAEAVAQAARDYAAAIGGNDRQRVTAVVSPVAALRAWMTTPSGGRVLRDQNTDSLAAMVASRSQPTADMAPVATVLGVDGDIASVKLSIGPATHYLHLGHLGGQWMVVNALTVPTRR